LNILFILLEILKFNFHIKIIFKMENDTLKLYEEIHKNSITDKEAFWKEEAKEIFWFKEGEKILDSSNPPFHRWFKDYKTNICYNCVDRHVEAGKGETLALISESAYSDKVHKYTYNELLSNINKMATIIKNNGVTKGDTVIIYMPMIAEAIFAMLACCRLGVIHSVVFGGFAASELADRINDAKPKLVITASVGIEPRKRIPYYPIVLDAMHKSYKTPILLVQREEFLVQQPDEDFKTYIFNDEIKNLEDVFVKCEEVDGDHPLYILYTSGTTGSPKGIVRDTGGTCVALNYTMKNIMDIDHKDIVASTSDIGWVVGHTFIVYGPLLRAATTIMFEGKPVGTPHCGKVWEIIEKYKVKAFYSSPTALRAIKREDYDHSTMKKYDLSSLKSIHMAGERCDPDTITWLQNGIGEDKLINDQWWQTETGWPICCNNLRIHRFKTIPGSAGRPLPGYDIKILNEELEILTEPHAMGKICISLPMPPSFMLTLWGNDQAFKDKYISKDNKYYITGDCGYFDENGYLNIMTRLDDVIKVAGHRLSTGRMEEVLTKMEGIVEAAVIGVNDELKGELPFAFIICKSGIDTNKDEVYNKLINEAKEHIVNEIGAISRLKGCIILQRLPKTRSGKIIRSLLRNIVNREELKIPSTIEDAHVLDEVTQELIKQKHL
jgi:propionyl-CoA synthetase